MEIIDRAVSAVQRVFNSVARDSYEIAQLGGNTSPEANDRILEIVKNNMAAAGKASDPMNPDRRALVVWKGLQTLLRDNGEEGCKRFAAFHEERGDYKSALQLIQVNFGIEGDNISSQATRDVTQALVSKFSRQIAESLKNPDSDWSIAEQMENIQFVRDLSRHGLLSQDDAAGFKHVVEAAIKVRQKGGLSLENSDKLLTFEGHS